MSFSDNYNKWNLLWKYNLNWWKLYQEVTHRGIVHWKSQGRYIKEALEANRDHYNDFMTLVDAKHRKFFQKQNKQLNKLLNKIEKFHEGYIEWQI